MNPARLVTITEVIDAVGHHTVTLAVIGAVTMLAANGDIDSGILAGILGTAIGYVGGAKNGVLKQKVNGNGSSQGSGYSGSA